MARLVVLRGDTVDRKVDLVTLPVRIGRGQANDVVLDDPMKGVSRSHAEIRLVNGRHVLVDLQSENGIWVAGRRVADVTLEPNVVASVGPFRLTIEDVSAASLPQGSTQAAPPAKAMSRPAPAPATPKVPRPAAPHSGAPPNRRPLMIGGAVAAVVVLGLVAALLLPSDTTTTDQEAEAPPPVDVNGPIADANRQMSEGLCMEAVQTIDLTLQQVPNDPDLLAAKRRVESECVPQPAIGEPVLDVVSELRTAKQLYESRECRAVLLRVTNVLLYEPDNAEAEALRKQALACPPLVTRPAEQRAQEKPAAEGGLAALPNELERDYQARMKAMRARYDEAMAALDKGVNPGVIDMLETLLRDTSLDYLDVAAKLAQARKAWLATARVHLNRARNLEEKGLFDDAIAALREAKTIDPALSVEADIARIEKGKVARGEEECEEGRASYNYRPAEAIERFRRALKLLPRDHPCYATAQKYAGSPGE